jgi:hypothetical protein
MAILNHVAGRRLAKPYLDDKNPLIFQRLVDLINGMEVVECNKALETVCRGFWG